MLQIDFKECCLECDNIEVDTEDEVIYGDGNDIHRVEIRCKHQCVCKEYREQSNLKKIVKNWTI